MSAGDSRICMVTAFGRGETLATALRQAGCEVLTLDFTEAFGPEYSRDVGPFPVALNPHLPAQSAWLGDMRPLPGGLTFWLDDGPIELAGEMAAHHRAARPAVKTLHARKAAADFADDWLRRFVDQFASPYHAESWENARGERFPVEASLGLPPGHRESVMLANHEAVRCESLIDLQFNAGRFVEIAVGAGRVTAYRAEQWVWCLSSSETATLNPDLAAKLLPRGIHRPEWEWVSFDVRAENGPWLEGLPGHVVVIGDVFLPWTFGNLVILRRRPGDLFQAWVRVPAGRASDALERARWANEVTALLTRRLDLARWVVDAEPWSICPHAPVFSAQARDLNIAPTWRNFEWIAPETLPRLDWGARLAREAEAHRRLLQWHRDQSKRRGAPRDHALHPS